MKRISKTFYTTDDDKSLLSLAGGKAYIERTYSAYSADELEELAKACFEAAAIIRKRMRQQANEAHAEVAS